MSVPQPKSPWYRDGLAFTCTRCGDCCTGAPGYVWVTIEEMRRLAEFRGETVEAFAERFVRLVDDRFSLIEKPGGDCIFWDKQVGLHRLLRPTRSMPRLAVLAREPGAAEELGARLRSLPRGRTGAHSHADRDPDIPGHGPEMIADRRVHPLGNVGGAPPFRRRAERALCTARCRGGPAGPGLPDQRPLLPIPRVRPYPVPLGPRGRLSAERGPGAGPSARRRRDLPLAGCPRPLHGARRPAPGLPRVLL